MPPNAANVKIYSAGSGKAKYEPEQNAIMWRIKKFQGDMEFMMNAEVSVTPLKSDKGWNRPPISLDFQVSFEIVVIILDLGTNVHWKWPPREILAHSGQIRL